MPSFGMTREERDAILKEAEETNDYRWWLSNAVRWAQATYWREPPKPRERPLPDWREYYA